MGRRSLTFWSAVAAGLVALLLVPAPAGAQDAGGVDPSVRRIQGGDRYETAAAVSRATFPDPAAVEEVFIATGEDFPDALAVAPLAAEYAPVLLVQRDHVPASTIAELERLDPHHITVFGGEQAVSQAVLYEVAHYGRETIRFAGATRYDTAARVALAAWDAGVGYVYVTTGQDFPDSVAAGAIAGSGIAPILLVQHDAVPQPTLEALQQLRPGHIELVGGTAVVSETVEEQLRGLAATRVIRSAGADRYGTAAEASRGWWRLAETVFVATGTSFPDALAGGPYAAALEGPILLVAPDGVPQPVRCEILRLRPSEVVVLGGPAAVSDDVVAELDRGYGELDRVGCPPPRWIGAIGGEQMQLVVDDRNVLFAVDGANDLVDVLDLKTGDVLASITVTDAPYDIDLTPDGRWAYVTSSTTPEISVIDVERLAEDRRIPVDLSGTGDDRLFSIAVAGNGKALFTSSFAGSGSTSGIWELDLATDETRQRTDTSPVTNRTSVEPSGDRGTIVVAMGNSSAGRMRVYDAVTDSFSPDTTLDTGILDVAVDRTGGTVLVHTSGRTLVLDRSLAQRGAIDNGTPPASVAIDADGQRGFRVTLDSEVEVLDLATFSVVDHLGLVTDMTPTGAEEGDLDQSVVTPDGSLLVVSTQPGFDLQPIG